MPLIAIISDVHGNLPALNSVLKALDKFDPDIYLCLGDIVGYGPNPGDCIDIIREKNMYCVLGNHDAGVIGSVALNFFRNPNKRLIEISRSLLLREQLDWLSSIPYTYENREHSFVCAHSSPENPDEWTYLNSAFKIREILNRTAFQYTFVGHTHIPSFVSDTLGVNSFQKGYKYLINPGSVGQSRDGDYRASCALLNTEKESLEFLRVDYDVNFVIRDLLNLGFSKKESNHLLRIK